MKTRKYSKTSFHKMYLIDKDMYERVLPHLSEVDKQDINEVNSGSGTDLNEEEPEMEKNNNQDDAPVTIASVNNVGADNSDVSAQAEASPIAEETLPSGKPDVVIHKKKDKKYSCPICVNKSFTTKHSMKRHHQSFHEEKQVLNGDATREEEKIINIKQAQKRKFIDEDNNSVSYEPLNKTAKYIQPEGVKRKREIEIDDLEQRKKFVPDTGQKRKRPESITDLQPKKKFHWSSY